MTNINKYAFEESQYIYIRRLKSHPIYKKHTHNFLECLLVVKGYGIHLHNDSYDILLPGSFFIIHINDTHEFIETHNLEVVNIDLFLHAWEQHAPQLTQYINKINNLDATDNKHITLSGQTLSKVNLLLYWAENEIKQKIYIDSVSTNTLVSAIISQIFITIIRSKQHIQAPDDLTKERNFYINQNINHDIIDLLYHYIVFDNNVLIANFASSRFRTYTTFIRAFKKMIGLNPKELQTKIKLFKSRKLIQQQPDLTIAQVATLSGFNDIAYFSKVFKKEFNTQPNKLKLQMKNNL